MDYDDDSLFTIKRTPKEIPMDFPNSRDENFRQHQPSTNTERPNRRPNPHWKHNLTGGTNARGSSGTFFGGKYMGEKVNEQCTNFAPADTNSRKVFRKNRASSETRFRNVKSDKPFYKRHERDQNSNFSTEEQYKNKYPEDSDSDASSVFSVRSNSNTATFKCRNNSGNGYFQDSRNERKNYYKRDERYRDNSRRTDSVSGGQFGETFDYDSDASVTSTRSNSTTGAFSRRKYEGNSSKWNQSRGHSRGRFCSGDNFRKPERNIPGTDIDSCRNQDTSNGRIHKQFGSNMSLSGSSDAKTQCKFQHKKYPHDKDSDNTRPQRQSSVEISQQNPKRFRKFLEGLKGKEPHDILFIMKDPVSDFTDLLNAEEVLKNAEWLVLLFEIIKTVCALEFGNSKYAILCNICNSKVIESVRNYLGIMCFERNKFVRDRFPSFIESLVIFYKAVIDATPTIAVEKDFQTLLKQTKMTIKNLQDELRINVDESLLQQILMLEDTIEELVKKNEKPVVTRKKRNFHEIMEGVPPPEDFRELSLYPTPQDLMSYSFGYLRPNKIKGAYDNVQHYLDVQFRLLREDFVDPFRRGIGKYKEAKILQTKRIKHKYDNIRFYSPVVFEDVEVMQKNGELAYVVNFDPNKKMKNVKWEFSRKFMFGSLVLFTTDDFNTFFSAMVVDRSEERLKKGNFLVTLTENFEVNDEFYNQQFLMAESDVYFGPYILVMKALKEFNDYNFPMKRFIVDGQRAQEYPGYTHRFMHEYEIEKFKVDLFELDTWPSKEALGLDQHQYRALQVSLTSDFAIIQGPPGTGKTFLGLKIVKTLLTNIRLTPGAVCLPILVVCYTNHALDQFLEGILDYTKRIVRIGAHSKSELLQEFNLRGKNNLRHLRDFNAKNVGRAMRQHKLEIQALSQRITDLNKKKKMIENPEGIFKLNLIAHLMSEEHQERITSNDILLEWLLSEHIDDNQMMEIEIPAASAPKEEKALDDYASEEEMDDEVKAIMVSGILVDEDDIFDIRDEVNAADTCEAANYIIYKKTLVDRYQEVAARSEHLLAEAGSVLKANPTQIQNIYECAEQLKNLKKTYNVVMHFFKTREKCDLEDAERVFHIRNPFDIPVRYRWALYWKWVGEMLNETANMRQKIEADYQTKLKMYEEFRQMEDLKIIKNAEIVGMTTACAAKFQSMLRTLGSSIVIVEEAAEALEAHIVTALTQKTEHVILIGDHKQLRPCPAVFELARRYHIDVSLFERMINNEMDCPSLNVQHRMRPEVSCLITPLIYPELENHDSVFKYERVPGITKSVFFVEHNEFEQEVEDTNTRKNVHEADFILQLCRYIYLQGYDPTKITILTTYVGQMYYMKDQKKKHYPFLKDVKLTVVDKYQGEENYIILLSLVRSNADARIGFLQIENRVCVALSRAKEGLFVIGNMDNLTKSSTLWQNIKETLQTQNAIGKEVTLYCEVHDIFTSVSKKEDFLKVPEGGCDNICATLLQCGHYCKKVCHASDRDHLEYNCREKCQKLCDLGHQCTALCFQECAKCMVQVKKSLPCGHEEMLPCHLDENEHKCSIIIDTVLPRCQHKAKKKCYEPFENVLCPEPCIARLECGHSCKRNCHKYDDPEHSKFLCRKPCEKFNKNCTRAHKCKKLCFEECEKCTIKELYTLKCGHKEMLDCALNPNLDTVRCNKKCTRECPNCRQLCKRKCYEDCQPCENMVTKSIPTCLHNAEMMCHDVPTRDLCMEKCERTAPCGHKCKGRCAVSCVEEKCQEIVLIEGRKGVCGHTLAVPCFEKDRVKPPTPTTVPLFRRLGLFAKPAAVTPKNKDEFSEFLNYCRHPCDTFLKCEHICSGTCGECHQGRLHVPCKEDCQNTLVCGHSCGSPCRQICPPCSKQCEFKCKHSECTKRCGVPCVPCLEPCEYKCKHSKCTKKCGEICDRKPCEESCENVLECGHPCIGFCGEPCPNKCRICDKEEVTEIVFGFEDEPDARFVFLEDCKHVIVSDALDQFLSMAPEGGEITSKVCPLCKTPITKTLRYMNYVKETQEHIINIKKQIYGKKFKIGTVLKELQEKAELINKEFPKFIEAGWANVNDIIKVYLARLKIKKKKKGPSPISIDQLKVMQYFIDIFQSIQSRLDDILKLEPSPNLEKAKDAVRFILSTMDAEANKINPQQVDDLLNEMKRFHKMIDLCEILSTNLYKMNKSDKEVLQYKTAIECILYKYGPYSEDEDKIVKKYLDTLQKRLNCPITDEEKRMVNLAMSSSFLGGARSTGHWFTCSNGHYYCITECGGAMQKANCPECGEVIGGERHTYVRTARLASDMDGATRPAWSTFNDILNFQL